MIRLSNRLSGNVHAVPCHLGTVEQLFNWSCQQLVYSGGYQNTLLRLDVAKNNFDELG